MRIVVAMKWVDTRPEIDPLTGEISDDERWFAASPADRSALEHALRLADERGGEVAVVCAGPSGADDMLRWALATGAASARRVDLDPALDSAAVATAVAAAIPEADLLVCGAWSLDRGTGSFPAFVAHRLEAGQALGCTVVEWDGDTLVAERRLDGGRRERVSLSTPAVVSVEAGVELRRASLRAVLGADDRPIEVVVPDRPPPPASRRERTGPYRPRSRELEAPAGDDVRERLLALTGALVDEAPSRALRLDPEAAAEQILAALGEHGIGPHAADGEAEAST